MHEDPTEENGDEVSGDDRKASEHTDHGPVKKTKRSFKKAPGAPKRGKSAYIIYCCEKRGEVKAQMPPDAKVTDVMKVVATHWKALEPAEKAIWEKKAAEDKLRYEAEIAHYDGPLKVPNKRQKKDPKAPKRAMSAFLHYSQAMRPRLKEQYPDCKNVSLSKLLGDEWGRMSEEEKAPYVARALQDGGRYKDEMTKWQSTSHGDEGIHDIDDDADDLADHHDGDQDEENESEGGET